MKTSVIDVEMGDGGGSWEPSSHGGRATCLGWVYDVYVEITSVDD